jgi:transcription antitermination factor NusG
MTANTVLSDINEIYTGYVLTGNKWYSADAKSQYEQRVKQAHTAEVHDAQGKAVVMAEEFVKWAKSNGYKGAVKGVWWTARPGSMAAAYGEPVDQKKNPTDILVKFTSGPSKAFLGLSAKATQGKGDIGFKNPGVGTVDRNLNMKLGLAYDKLLKDTIKSLKLPDAAQARKQYLRSNPGIKAKTEKIGVDMMADMRDQLLTKLKKMKQPELKKYLLSDWMDAEVISPPYIKVTGQGSKPPYKAMIMDPVDNPKLDALAKYPITLEKVGNESIGVMAGEKKIMKIRFKFESEKMASSLKLSGDPW